MTKKLAAVHPGELRREDFLEPMDLSAGALARVVGVPRTRIERLINGPTRRCGRRVPSVRRQRFGWGCGRNPVLSAPRTNSAAA